MTGARALGRSLSLAAILTGCGACGGALEAAGPPPVPPPSERASAPTYEVHEWGLVQGTADDRAMLSGPHALPVAMPVAKPVLYFHREGEGPLTVEVRVDVPHGRLVEHWPLDPSATDASLSWRAMRVEAGSCAGARYPGVGDAPCVLIGDGCEAAELATVETRDGDCLRDADGTPWNHLFYRGEVLGAPALPLRLRPLPGGGLQVTHEGTEPVPGLLVRLGHPRRGETEAALVAEPPAPGATVVLAAPHGGRAEGAEALSRSLRAAGLTAQEAAAFRRAWDGPLFGPSPLAAADSAAEARPAAASPAADPALPARSTSLLYVLPSSSADTLATLRLTPAPRAVRRAIVAWIDEARAP